MYYQQVVTLRMLSVSTAKRVMLDFETGIEEFSEQDKDWPRIQNH